MSTFPAQRVELSSVDVSPNGESFVLGLVAADQALHRMELPAWAVHQLMRVLPRLDAALQQGGAPRAAPGLVAHAVVQWCVEPVGIGAVVAMSLKNDQHVESAYLLDAEAARAMHAALGEAIGAAGACPEADRSVF